MASNLNESIMKMKKVFDQIKMAFAEFDKNISDLIEKNEMPRENEKLKNIRARLLKESHEKMTQFKRVYDSYIKEGKSFDEFEKQFFVFTDEMRVLRKNFRQELWEILKHYHKRMPIQEQPLDAEIPDDLTRNDSGPAVLHAFAQKKEPPVRVVTTAIESLEAYRRLSVQDVRILAENVQQPAYALMKTELDSVGLNFGDSSFVNHLLDKINTAAQGKYELTLKNPKTGQTESTISNAYDEVNKRAQTIIINPTKHALVATMLLRKSMAPPMKLDSEDPETALEVYEAAKLANFSAEGLDHLLSTSVKAKLQDPRYQETFASLQKLEAAQLVQMALAHPNRELGKAIPEEWLEKAKMTPKREGPG